ncbi:hypothetical protein [Actinokineospora enzanensis]|uniref:hypothetical protein n=1 Tax=Actinokineospora enzanensis TaxID=155975 RepID=UPI00037015D5|nr:hypothetical protein [Actinokineospora enzanensis]
MTATTITDTVDPVDAYLRAGRIIAAHETRSDMIERVTAALCAADCAFYPAGAAAFGARLRRAMDARQVVFSTPIMTNAGRHPDRALAACVVPPVDLRGDLAAVAASVHAHHQAGMGTGFRLDEVTDPVTVLRHLNTVAVEGACAGREDRPVGNMAVLSLDHPRVQEFIDCKLGADTRGEIWKFNISLLVTDAQMRAADAGPGRERDLLSAAARAVHACADPGLVFIDRLEATNPTPHLGAYVSTAPCAEVGLATGEACQFGYLNLGAFHRPDGDVVPVDLDALAETTALLVRALDDAIEASLPHYPSPVTVAIMTAKRKIGIGICGLADLLLTAGLPYGSPDAIRLTRDLVAFVNYHSKLASVTLAEARGPAPAVADGRSRYADPDFLRRFARPEIRTVTPAHWDTLADRIATTGQLRHAHTVALPPTGRSAPVIGASTGIEPLFRLTSDHTGDLHPAAAHALRQAGRTDLIGHIHLHGKLPRDHGLPAPLADLLATATDLEPAAHLAMTAAAQAGVDDAVSKTVNLPADATVEQVHDILTTAWRLGCAGVTVYRDGSRGTQPKPL